MPKGSKQEDLVFKAVKTVLDDANVTARWPDLGNHEPTEKNPQRTLLEKCLTNYTTNNTADYFIHKDLGGFLRREIDFYIKNEVLHLDDVQNARKLPTSKEPAHDSNPACYCVGLDYLPCPAGGLSENTLAEKEICRGYALLHHARPCSGKPLSRNCRQPAAMGTVGQAGNAGWQQNRLVQTSPSG